jgi:hypothetical protein
MTVIVINGEPSSYADEVATRIADQLHLSVAGDPLIQTYIAERLDIDPILVRREFESKSLGLNPWRQRRKRFLRAAAEKVLELATNGSVVIQGWGAAEILQPVAHVLRVCVTTGKEPLHRSKWLKWNPMGHSDAGNYDVVFAARVSIQACVEHIHRLAHNPEFEETPASRAALDRLLAAAREDAPRLKTCDTQVCVHVDLGRDRLTLPNTLSTDERIARVEMHWRGENSGGDRTRRTAIFGEGLFH